MGSINGRLHAGKKKMGFFRIPADIRLIRGTFVLHFCLVFLANYLLCNFVTK